MEIAFFSVDKFFKLLKSGEGLIQKKRIEKRLYENVKKYIKD
jgi:hypothetical protein